ncbi:hypothetical protein Dimus_001519 [Dionaea muscipula]
MSAVLKDTLLIKNRMSFLFQFFEENISLKLGNGQDTFFWLDKWCKGVTLKSLFPWLFLLSNNQRALVADYVANSGGDCAWIFPFEGFLRERQKGILLQLRDFGKNGGDITPTDIVMRWKELKEGICLKDVGVAYGCSFGLDVDVCLVDRFDVVGLSWESGTFPVREGLVTYS